MFLVNSRYFGQETVTRSNGSGRSVKVVKLRRLPNPSGNLTIIRGEDRLDIISHRRYDDATKFWHIADANTEMEAPELDRYPGYEIIIP